MTLQRLQGARVDHHDKVIEVGDDIADGPDRAADMHRKRPGSQTRKAVRLDHALGRADQALLSFSRLCIDLEDAKAERLLVELERCNGGGHPIAAS